MDCDLADPAPVRLGNVTLFCREGVFYAEVEHPTSEAPFSVVLHGVSSNEQALQAASALCRAGGKKQAIVH